MRLKTLPDDDTLTMVPASEVLRDSCCVTARELILESDARDGAGLNIWHHNHGNRDDGSGKTLEQRVSDPVLCAKEYAWAVVVVDRMEAADRASLTSDRSYLDLDGVTQWCDIPVRSIGTHRLRAPHMASWYAHWGMTTAQIAAVLADEKKLDGMTWGEYQAAINDKKLPPMPPTAPE